MKRLLTFFLVLIALSSVLSACATAKPSIYFYDEKGNIEKALMNVDKIVVNKSDSVEVYISEPGTPSFELKTYYHGDWTISTKGSFVITGPNGMEILHATGGNGTICGAGIAYKCVKKAAWFLSDKNEPIYIDEDITFTITP